jgi:hypothetical protein
MNARQAFDYFLSKLAVALKPEGFTRDRATFRLKNEHDDFLIVETQTNEISNDYEVVFYVNVGLVLAPRWQWFKQQHNRAPTELPRHVDGSYRRRLAQESLGGSHQWRVYNQQSGDEVAVEIIGLLREELPWLKGLLNRDELLGMALRNERLGHASWQVAAWLLAASEGRSERLEQLLAERPQVSETPVYAAILRYAEEVHS